MSYFTRSLAGLNRKEEEIVKSFNLSFKAKTRNSSLISSYWLEDFSR